MTETRPLCASLRHLSRALLAADLADLPDSELLWRFAERRDEAAFAVLVHRHGALVLGVCRRVLRHEQDAEDAFQATFLVFARDAASVWRSGSIGSWLYGVAYNIARRAKTARHRRAVKEQEAAARHPTATPEIVPDDLWDVLDGELNALPVKYRAAVVLCDVMGLTTQQAATEVGCPPKTLGTRLARGRSLLARRLVRRGVGLPACGVVGVLASSATAAIPPRLRESTIHAATKFAAGSTVAVDPAVAALIKGVSNVMVSKALKIAAVLTCSVLLVGVVERHGSFAHATPTSAPTPSVSSVGNPTGQKPVARADVPNHLDHMRHFLGHIRDLLGWIDPKAAQVSATPAEDKDKTALSGVWVKKDGELKIEFVDKNVLNITPHGENKVIVIICEYTPEKDGVVKAKITGFEGKEDATKQVMGKLPVGTKFSFKWKVKADSATLDEVKGDKDKAELLKSHLEAEYTKK
jgi:RNA polymerase sigma factor (sigma-70 family)